MNGELGGGPGEVEVGAGGGEALVITSFSFKILNSILFETIIQIQIIGLYNKYIHK